jgi:ribonuclease BN (tRNA processing enzyme)
VPPDATTLTGDVAGYRTKLVLLGTAGGPPPSAGRRGVASAVVVGDRAYLVDAGYGTVRTLFQAGISIADIEQVFITHTTHSDHIVDLFNLIWLNRSNLNLARPLPVHGPGSAGRLPTTSKPLPLVDPDRPPPGTSELLAGLLGAYAYEINIRAVESSDPRDIRSDLAAHDVLPPSSAGATPDNTAPALAPFPVFEDSRVKVSAILVPHGPVFPSFAYRFDTEDGAVVFSGDTGYSPNVARIADGADILVHEAIDLDALSQAGLSGTTWSNSGSGARPDGRFSSPDAPARRTSRLDRRPPTQCRTEVARDVGEDLQVVLGREAEGQREHDLADLLEAGVRVQLLGDPRGRAHEVPGEQQPLRSLG